MKKIIFLALVALTTLSSCMYSGHFGKRPLYLVGAPEDIRVTQNGKKIDVKVLTMANIVERQNNGFKERTKYRHPAALVKIRRNNTIQLSSGGKTANLSIKGKAGKGIVFLILEAPFTLGIGTIVDLATVSFYYPPSKYIDVQAVLNNTTPKTKKELYKEALENSSKEITIEYGSK